MSDRKLTCAAAWAAIVGMPLSLISIALAVFVHLVPTTTAGNSAVGSPVSSSQTPSAPTSSSLTTEKPAVTTPAPEAAATEPGAFEFWVESDGKRTYLGWNHTWSWWQLMLWWTIPAAAVLAMGAFLVAKFSGRLSVLFVAVPVGFPIWSSSSIRFPCSACWPPSSGSLSSPPRPRSSVSRSPELSPSASGRG